MISEEIKNAIKSMSKEDRKELCKCVREYEETLTPRYSCKRGDVVKFWSGWRDFSKGISLERIERIAIALDDCNEVTESTMLEYIITDMGVGRGCWRYERVDGDKFIEVIGHVDLSEWESLTERLWEGIK